MAWPKGKPRTEETKAKLRKHIGCSIENCESAHFSRGWCRAHYLRWYHHKDTKDTVPVGRSQLHDRNGQWLGNDAGYGAIHRRARIELPQKCYFCGELERLEVALVHERGNKTENGLLFSTDLNDYIRLCVECHRRYDLARK